ncbi:MAG: AbrB/MazE/SpoVT family DNA-binding domain-containing protein [Desulfurococcales archaeon]|nr:AbrB/MazE/SpoVT family DNA-binding domain-containing protein [Desulfurococcales archaeon]
MPGDPASSAVEWRLRVGKKRAIYLPKDVLRAVGLSVGDQVIVRVEGDRIIIERAPDPFLLAVKRRMWAKTTVDEFEEESEYEQEEWN